MHWDCLSYKEFSNYSQRRDSVSSNNVWTVPRAWSMMKDSTARVLLDLQASFVEVSFPRFDLASIHISIRNVKLGWRRTRFKTRIVTPDYQQDRLGDKMFVKKVKINLCLLPSYFVPEHVCHPSPCMHEGRCSVESGHFKCLCPPLFKGDVCES